MEIGILLQGDPLLLAKEVLLHDHPLVTVGDLHVHVLELA
jgi:hypothetical protein